MRRSLITVFVSCALTICLGARGFAQARKPAAKEPAKKARRAPADKPARKPASKSAAKDASQQDAPQPVTEDASKQKDAPQQAAQDEKKPASKTATKPAAKTTRKGAGARQAAAEAELAELLKLPAAERVVRLQAFAEGNAPAALKARAVEHLVSAHAALGDERLQAGDAAGGVAAFRQAVALAPNTMSDRLYVEVVAQFPANLFLRGQGEAAVEVARLVEAKVKDNPQRLLALAPFYLQLEQADEAARLADEALALAPDLAAAHQARGAARRLQLRLDEATAEYRRALELDPKSALSRRNLADLLRATGKPADALALYREQLAADPNDRPAQTGVVLALLDAGQREDAERELTAALEAEPRNLLLLVGAGYWFAAHGDAARALELAGRAVQLEPRYTWAQITAARALVAQQRAADAERALRFARQYGRFPTLDYELANALAAAGLYEEAAEELTHSFALKGDQLETQLAGRVPTQAASFIDLLAPERRASIYQFAPADTEANARALKGLFAFYLALSALDAPGADAAAHESALTAAARDFTAGEDDLRAFRQLYVADRLARRGVALTTAAELAEAAKAGVEAAAATPAASVAVAADELRSVRARAIAAGGTPNFPAVPREALLKILRGRTEELLGWALFNQGKTAEAAVALRRAVSVLPDGSLYARNAQWRLGSVLAAAGQPKDALAAYLKGYDRQAPDPTRRAIIENAYTKVHGSLAGLDALIGPAPAVAEAPAAASPAPISTSPAPARTSSAPARTSPATLPAEYTTPSAAPAATPAASAATSATSANTSATPTATPAEVSTPPTETSAQPAPTPTPSETPANNAADAPKTDAPRNNMSKDGNSPARNADDARKADDSSVRKADDDQPRRADDSPPRPVETDAPPPKPSESPAPPAEDQPPAVGVAATPTHEPPSAVPTPTPVESKPDAPVESKPASVEPAPPDVKPTNDAKSATTDAKPAATDAEPAVESASSAGASRAEGRGAGRVRPRRAKEGAASACALALSVESMLLTSNGGASTVTATLEGQASGTTDIEATTANWADIIVLREPQDPAPNAARYTVTSISRKTGTFLVTFKSSCGTKAMAVAVK
ncbi:MAG TPA: tetratricopeptide repeat protein [Pyrinomonadaceae bacterium]|jgi:hypothetical protein